MRTHWPDVAIHSGVKTFQVVSTIFAVLKEHLDKIANCARLRICTVIFFGPVVERNMYRNVDDEIETFLISQIYIPWY